MKLSISYTVTYGPGDGSDCIDYDDIELTEKESNAVMYFALTEDFESIIEAPELSDKMTNVYSDIDKSETENSLDLDDEYAKECLGTNRMDVDELNDLVHGKDQHALEFFNLEDADDEEIAKWDANDLEDIPTVAEFDPDFEPSSPYSNGWSLDVFVSDVTISEDDIRTYFKEQFKNGDLEAVDSAIDDCTLDIEIDISEVAFVVAQEVGCKEYIDAHTEED